MAKLPDFDPYAYLARRRFPRAYIIRDVKPGDYTEDRKDQYYRTQAATYIEELRDKTPAELAALVEEAKIKEAGEAAYRQNELEARQFYNQPYAQADFDHWSKAAYWTLEEAIALSFGKDPRRVTWKRLEAHLSASPFVKRYRDLRDLALRAKAMGQLYDPVLPGFFIAWAKRIEAEFNLRLVELVEARGGKIADWQELYNAEKKSHEETRQWANAKFKELLDNGKHQQQQALDRAKEQHARALEIGQSALAEKDEVIEGLQGELRVERERQTPDAVGEPRREVSTRERSSMLKLIIGMAVQGYRYDKTAKKNSAVAEIVGDLDALGISLDEDTVRKYLNEGKDLLPGDKTE